MNRKSLFVVIALLLSTAVAKAVVYPGSPFKSGMVLQQKTNVQLWGKAKPGATVSVTPSWDESAVTTCQADNSGRWRMQLATPAASFDRQKLTFSDGVGEDKVLTNILIGEVWITSGQSNMEMPVSGWDVSPIHNVDSIVNSAANYTTKLRYVCMPYKLNQHPQDSAAVTWQSCTKNTAQNFSLVAYLFATHLIDSLNVPVGIINASYGGSDIVGWIPVDVLRTCSDIVITDDTYSTMNQSKPAADYNGLIHPIRGYTVSGFLWYQGENNVYTRPTDEYTVLLSNLIKSWRNLWGQGDLPFYIVELAPYSYGDVNGTNGAFTRERQNIVTHMLPNVRIVGTNDQVLPTETEQIHPSHKLGLCQRLGNFALHDVYGFSHLHPVHPEMKSVRYQGDKAYVKFTESVGGFNLTEGITGFEIGGSDGNFRTATAVVEGDEVVLSQKAVSRPTAVRYCFRNFLLGNLKNQYGLPPLPFRSDNNPIAYIPETTWAPVERLAASDLAAGDTILLAGASCIEANGNFFNGSTMRSGTDENSAFVLETAPDIAQTGRRAFYLKHVETKLYVSALNIDNASLPNCGSPQLVGKDEAAAFCFAAASDTVQTTSSRTPGWDDKSVCIVHPCFSASGYTGHFLCHQWDTNQALVATYRYLCAWNVYRAHATHASSRPQLGKAIAYADFLKTWYASGTDPGYIEPAYLSAWQQCLEESKAVLLKDATEEEVGALLESLQQKTSDLDLHSVPVTEGYYQIVSGYTSLKENRALYGGEDGLLHWGIPEGIPTEYVFRVTQGEDGLWNVQCITTQMYIGPVNGKTGLITMTKEPTGVSFRPFNRGQWSILPPNNDQTLYADGFSGGSESSGNVKCKTDVYGSPSSWYLRKITDPDLISYYNASAKTMQLERLIAACQALSDSTQVGTALGDVTQQDKDAFTEAIATARPTDELTEEQVNERIAILSAQRDVFRQARVSVVPGQWYYILNMDQSESSPYSGQALYMKSSNRMDCYRWSSSADIAAWGLSENAYLHNPFAMWRFVPIEDADGQYLLQNRATGAYISGPASGRFGVSIDGACNVVPQLLGHAQMRMALSDGDEYTYLSPVESSQAIQTGNGGFDSPSAWNLLAISDDGDSDYLELKAETGSVSIVCLPFAAQIQTSETLDVHTYALKNVTAEGQVQLTTQSQFDAGEPFFLLLGSLGAKRDDGVLRLAVTSDDFVAEGQNANGLIGILNKVQLQSQGKMYFSATGDLKTSARLPFIIEGGKGYIDPEQTSDAGGRVDLALGNGADAVHAVVVDGSNPVDVYAPDGRIVRKNVPALRSTENLPKGIYIIGNKKIVVS